MRAALLVIVAAAVAPASAGFNFKLPLKNFRWPWQKKASANALATSPLSQCAKGDETCSALSSTCAADGTCASATAAAPTPTDMYGAPDDGRFVVDPAGLLTEYTHEILMANLTKFNRTSSGIQCYLAVFPTMPMPEEGSGERIPTARDFSRQLLRTWFERSDRKMLIVLLAEQGRMEVAMGSRAKRKLKDSGARRIARKVQGKMADSMDAAARLAVKEVTQALGKEKGFAGSLRSMLMPIVIVLVLGFMFMKNQQAKPGMGGGGMGGFGGMGMEGMGGMGDVRRARLEPTGLERELA
jgi:hypothetical protein